MTGVLKFPSSSQSEVQTNDNNVVIDETGENTDEEPVSAFKLDVTIMQPGQSRIHYLDLTGTVKPKDQVSVFSINSGQLNESYVSLGDKVVIGQPLFVIGGIGEIVHPSKRQAEIAANNYNVAKTAYEIALRSTQSAVALSELQLENAINQTNGYLNDETLFYINGKAVQYSRNLAQDTLSETRTQYERNYDALEGSISSLEETLETLKSQENPIDSLTNEIPATGNELIDQAVSAVENYTQQQTEAQIKQLEAQLKTLEQQRDNLASGLIMTENQMNGQIGQLDAQGMATNINQQSARIKMGLDENNSSTAIKQAEIGVENANNQRVSGLAQAKNQMVLAEISMEMANDQADALTIKAPISGKIIAVNNVSGDIVSPQTVLAQIVNEDSYELKVSVDVRESRSIPVDGKAQLKIGDRFVNLPIKSVSPLANSASRLVEVTVELPNLSFKPNENIQVRIPVSMNSGTGMLIPLDSVIIGTEETYVYVVENGLAVKRTVVLGDIFGNLVQIRSGLSFDDQLIVEGAKKAFDGEKVNIIKD